MRRPTRNDAQHGFRIICWIWFAAGIFAPIVSLYSAVPDSLIDLLYFGDSWGAVLAWFSIPSIALIFAADNLRKLQYRAALSWLAVPFLSVVLYSSGVYAGTQLRFFLNRSQYDRVVADITRGHCSALEGKKWRVAVDLVDCGEIPTVSFPWGGFSTNWYGLIYDAGDEIMLPPEKRTHAWKQRALGGLLACSFAPVSLGGHYYRAGGNYAC